MAKTDYRQAYDAIERLEKKIANNKADVVLAGSLNEYRPHINEKLNVDIQTIPLFEEYAEYDRQINTMLDLEFEEILKQFGSEGKRSIDDIKTYHTLMHTLNSTMSRASDLTTVKVKDIDFTNGIIRVGSTKTDVAKIGLLLDYNNGELANMLKDLTKDMKPDDFVFKSSTGLPVATDDINRYIQDLARTTKGVDVANFGLLDVKDGLDWGDDYKTAISKTFRKHGSSLLALAEGDFMKFNVNMVDYSKNALGHLNENMQQWYSRIAGRIKMEQYRGSKNVILTQPHPRSKALIDQHILQAIKVSRSLQWLSNNNRFSGLLREEAKFGETPTTKKKKKQIKTEVKEDLSEYQQLKNRLKDRGTKAVSPNKIEQFMMPAGLSKEEQEDFILRKGRGEVDIASPLTDEPDPRLETATSPEELRKKQRIKNAVGRNVAVNKEKTKDLEFIGNVFNEESQIKAKQNIKLREATPTIVKNFINNEEFTGTTQYFNKISEKMDNIVNSVAQKTVLAEDILKLGDNVTSWENIGDLGEFFGKAGQVGDDVNSLAIKIPPKVANEFLQTVEYRSRLQRIAHNMVEESMHTLTPDKFKGNGLGTLEHVIDKLKISVGKFAEDYGVLDGTDDFTINQAYYVNSQDKPSNLKFLEDLTEALDDAGATVGKEAEYAPLKTHYFDDLITNNVDFFGELSDDTKKAFTIKKKGAENSLIRTVQLEPLYQAFYDEGIFNDLAFDKDGAKNTLVEYDRPLSERLGTVKNDGRPVLRNKDYGQVNRTNFVREDFDEILPNLNTKEVDGNIKSIGRIEHGTDRILPPGSFDVGGEVAESQRDTIMRTILNKKVVKGFGVITTLKMLGSNTAVGKTLAFGTNVLADIGMELAFANYDTLMLDFQGNALFDKVSGVAPEYSSGKTYKNLREIALNDPKLANEFLNVNLKEAGYDEPLEAEGYFERALSNVRYKVSDFFREITDAGIEGQRLRMARETGIDVGEDEGYQEYIQGRREEERETARPLAGRSLTETQEGFTQKVQDEIAGFESGYGYGSPEKAKQANPRGYMTGKRRYDDNIKIQEQMNNLDLSTNQEGEDNAVNG